MVNPTIREGPCGVYDFTVLLSTGLRSRYDRLVEIAPQTVNRKALANAFGLVWGDTPNQTLNSVLERTHCSTGAIEALIIQYSGYGFNSTGAPSWLPKELALFRNQHPDTRIVTFFHEMYASSPIWTRGFWHSGRQRSVVKELVKVSDHIFTNCLEHQNRLSVIFGVPEVALSTQAVPSNVGEPGLDSLTPANDREPTAIVFGGMGIRDMVLKGNPAALAAVLKKFSIKRVFEIGPGSSQAAGELLDVVEFLGVLEAQEISRRLMKSRYGLISYPVEFLGKSTVFSAFQSHGLVAINMFGNAAYRPDPKLSSEGIAHWSDAIFRSNDDLASIAALAGRSYAKHSSQALVEAFGRVLGLD